MKRVKAVRVSIGELAGVDIPSLEFAWTSVRKGGPAENAALEIERPRKRYGDPCPECGGYRLAATGGTEMKVVDILEASDG